LGSALPAAPASSQYHGCKASGIVSRILDASGEANDERLLVNANDANKSAVTSKLIVVCDWTKISSIFREDSTIFSATAKPNGLVGPIKLVKLSIVGRNGLIGLIGIIGRIGCVSQVGLVSIVSLVSLNGIGLVGYNGIQWLIVDYSIASACFYDNFQLVVESILIPSYEGAQRAASELIVTLTSIVDFQLVVEFNPITHSEGVCNASVIFGDNAAPLKSDGAQSAPNSLFNEDFKFIVVPSFPTNFGDTFTKFIVTSMFGRSNQSLLSNNFQLVVKLIPILTSEGARAPLSKLIVGCGYSEISFHFCDDCRIFREGVKDNTIGIVSDNGIVGHINHNGLNGVIGLGVSFIGLGFVGFVGLGPFSIAGLICHISLIGLVGSGITSLLGSSASSARWLIGLVGFTIHSLATIAAAAILSVVVASQVAEATILTSATKMDDMAFYNFASSSFHVYSLQRKKVLCWLAFARKKMWRCIASFGDSYHGDVLQFAKQIFSVRLP
jgi:hypothetical protein